MQISGLAVNNDTTLTLDSSELDEWNGSTAIAVAMWLRIDNNESPGLHEWFCQYGHPHPYPRRLSLYDMQTESRCDISWSIRRPASGTVPAVVDTRAVRKYRSRLVLLCGEFDSNTGLVRLTLNACEAYRGYEISPGELLAAPSSDITIASNCTGVLAQLMMFNRNLSDDELTSLYNGGVPRSDPPSNGLIHHWIFPSLVSAGGALLRSSTKPFMIDVDQMPEITIPASAPDNTGPVVSCWAFGDSTLLALDSGFNSAYQLKQWNDGRQIMPWIHIDAWWQETPQQLALFKRNAGPVLRACRETGSDLSVVTTQPEGWFRSLLTDTWDHKEGPWSLRHPNCDPLNNDFLSPFSEKAPWVSAGYGLAWCAQMQWIKEQLQGYEGTIYIVSNNESPRDTPAIAAVDCRLHELYPNWKSFTDEDLRDIYVKGWRRLYTAMWLQFQSEFGMPDVNIVGYNGGGAIPYGYSVGKYALLDHDGNSWMSLSGFDTISYNVYLSVTKKGTALSSIGFRHPAIDQYFPRVWANSQSLELSMWAPSVSQYSSKLYGGAAKLWMLMTKVKVLRHFANKNDSITDYGGHFEALLDACEELTDGPMAEFYRRGRLIDSGLAGRYKPPTGFDVFNPVGWYFLDCDKNPKWTRPNQYELNWPVFAIGLEHIDGRTLVYAMTEDDTPVENVSVFLPDGKSVWFDVVPNIGVFGII